MSILIIPFLKLMVGNVLSTTSQNTKFAKETNEGLADVLRITYKRPHLELDIGVLPNIFIKHSMPS